MYYASGRLGTVVRFVVVLKPQGLRFDPELVNYVYRTMLANNLAVNAKININVQLKHRVFYSYFVNNQN